MRKILVIAALLALIAPSGPPVHAAANVDTATGEAERQILRLIDEWVAALKHNDGAALERIFADDFHIVESDGRTRGKADELEPVRSGRIKFERLTVEDVHVFVSGDTAIATGISTFSGTAVGRPFEGRERFFDVYKKMNGRWKILASRPTPAPGGPRS